jgi:tRNA C32,U32 (ribose-2'-O)-methylase TrmJ
MSTENKQNKTKQNKIKPEKEITEYGLIGTHENNNIFFNEGVEFGDYLRCNNINFSIHEKFKPLTLSKALKIINYKLMKMNENEQDEKPKPQKQKTNKKECEFLEDE